MPDFIADPTTMFNTWKTELEMVECENCHWFYLSPTGRAQNSCPHCHRPSLAVIPNHLASAPHPYPPELVVPFNLPRQELDRTIEKFARGIPYPPENLNPRDLQARLSPVYFPVWLVDAQVQATWEGEAGFDYEVISHQETYRQDSLSWQSHEVKETRTRWENRVGKLNRLYQNVTAPAMDDLSQITQKLGGYHVEKAQPYHPDYLKGAFVRLPDQTPATSWGEAIAAFQKVASDECMNACAAEHLRQFHWTPSFDRDNWTLMLLPAYTSYYLDDQGTTHQVMIHGQTGAITGARRASMRRAGNTCLVLLLLGIILFLLGLITESFTQAFPFVGGLSTIMILIGIVSSVGSVVPYLSAWDFNHKNQD
jgi:hypothetical protein